MSNDVPVGVAILLHNWQGHLLMIQRRGPHGAGQWAVPGGKVDPGEAPEQAVVRELAEEAGLHTRRPTFVVETDDVFDNGMHFLTRWYRCHLWDGAPRLLEPAKHLTWAWRMTPPEPLFEPCFANLRKLGIDPWNAKTLGRK